MSSELELLRQCISELEAKNAKLEAEKAELLKQVMEKDAKRDVENTELKSRVGELEARLAILEQSPPIVNGQPENDKEVSSEVSVVVVPDSSPIHEVHNHLKLTEQIEEVLKVPDQEKTSEDMETDAFLVEAHKKNIGDEIRKRNKEKKLNKAVEDQVSLQKISDTASSISSSEKLVSTKNGQGLIQEISRNLAESATPSSIQGNDSTCALSLNPPEISVISGKENIICLYQRASDAEGLAMKANQEEILSWYLYAKEFLIMVKDIMASDRVGEKKAKGQIYDFIVQQLPDTKRDNLCKQTQRAIKIFDLFEKIGIDKVRYIKTYSANSISKITNTDLQKVIDHFSNNSNSFTEPEISPTSGRPNHVTKISETVCSKKILPEVNVSTTPKPAEVSISTTPIPSTHVSNSSSETSPGNTSKTEVSTSSTISSSKIGSFNNSRLPISILPEDPEEKRKHIIGLVLEKFPYLSLDDSDERRDTFNLDSSTLCPLCKGDHKEKRSIFDGIKGEWGAGEYYGEQTYRLECRDAFNRGIPIVSVKA